MATETETVIRVSRETSGCTKIDDATGEACGLELDTTGYPRWCKSCRAKHRNAYNATVKEMSETRGFAAGAAAMKAALTARVSALGNGKFTGLQLASWISKFQMKTK